MAIFRAFKAFRPAQGYQKDIASLPYDVMNSEEARQMTQNNKNSFLFVDKAEINFEKDVDVYSDEVYKMAGDKLRQMENDGLLIEENANSFYIYQQIMNGESQVGLVGCASIDDYMNNIIKKHEHTRSDKEQDRIKHVSACDANTGPIFLTYRENDKISDIIADQMNNNAPIYDFTSDEVSQRVWVINDQCDITTLTDLFATVPSMYIADGHHRCASAVKVGIEKRKTNPSYSQDDEFNRFLAVAFPKEQLRIMPYNRTVKDLNSLTAPEFIVLLEKDFEINALGNTQFSPESKHSFGMCLQGTWYSLKAKNHIISSDIVKSLDVSILQDYVLAPILGINDPKTDKRIDFIGGIRGLDELEKRVASDMTVAFSMYPTSMDELLAIADAGEIMPPKSTWFEPKLLSGLFIHHLS